MFKPNIIDVDVLEGEKPEVGSNYTSGIVTKRTLLGVKICTNFESGLGQKILNCPECPVKDSCGAYNTSKERVL